MTSHEPAGDAEKSVEPAASPPAALDRRRDEVAGALQRAVGEGRLTFEEYCDRVRATYAAHSSDELESTVRDLAVVQQPASALPKSSLFNVFGDIKRIGAWRIADKTTMVSIFGDIVLDLRSAYLQPGDIEISGFSMFGDLRIIVPDGVEASVGGFALFGDQSCELSGIRVPGAPGVRVRWFSIFGDADVAHEGTAKRWVRKITGRQ